MKTDFEKLFSQTHLVSLTESEKSSMWQQIKDRTTAAVISPYAKTFGFFARVRIAAVSMLILPFLVAAASEASLPGNTLYAVKVNVNEEVVRLLSPTSESKAKWEIRRIERRLEEAQQLAVSGSIDTKTSALIETGLSKHIARAENDIEHVDEVNKKEATDLSSNLSVTLNAHETVLEESVKVAAANEAASLLALKVEETSRIVGEKDKLREAEIASELVDIETVQVELTEDLNELLDTVALSKSIVPVAEEKDLPRHDVYKDLIDQAEEKLEEAKDLLAEGKIGDARVAIRRAKAAAEEAQKIVEARASLGIGAPQEEEVEEEENVEEEEEETVEEVSEDEENLLEEVL